MKKKFRFASEVEKTSILITTKAEGNGKFSRITNLQPTVFRRQKFSRKILPSWDHAYNEITHTTTMRGGERTGGGGGSPYVHLISVTEPSAHCLHETIRDNKTPQSVYRCVECVQLATSMSRNVRGFNPQ